MESQVEDWIPRMDMEFQTLEEAWLFWKKYSGKMGFGVRKDSSKKNKNDGVITSMVFVCTHEGKKAKDKRDDQVKNPRAETRTGCLVRLKVKFNRGIQRYGVVDFVSEHNHQLQKRQACHLLRSQREVSEVAGFDIELADDSGIWPKKAHGLMCRQVGGPTNLGFTIRDHQNYLRDKRERVLISGEAVAMMNYFHKRVMENSSFHHVEQIDDGQEITNIFWADAKMIADYSRFGDVVAFDTTFGTNKEYRPFGVFVGFNNFREIVVFGATLMYDQTSESFEWVFKTFLEVHDGKKPKTIFTDQDSAIGKALEKIMPETTHGLCTWHISENCTKHLMRYVKDNMNPVREFKTCMYEFDEEEEFEKAFSDLMKEVSETNWLSFIYEHKKKWAYCFMKNEVTLGMCSTQLSESINSDIKEYLNSNMDIIRVFNQFERVLDGKREKEIVSEFDSKFKQPKFKVKVPITLQVGPLYTPKIFALFQEEYELSMGAQIDGQMGNEYTVSMYEFDNVNHSFKSHKVVWNRDDQTVLCACKKFEREGILCWHALKVLDRENIKLLPQKYILKRWTREAINETVMDKEGRVVIEDTRLDMSRRNRDISRTFGKLSAMSIDNEELTKFVDRELHSLCEKVAEMRISLKMTNGCNEGTPTPITINNPSQSTYRLKKKEGAKGSKRKQSWNEKPQKTSKTKTTNISTSQASIRSNSNFSQEKPQGEQYGCFVNLEDKYDLEILQ